MGKNNRSGEPTGNVTHTLNKLADEAGFPRFLFTI
jgi:hypothetical protein